MLGHASYSLITIVTVVHFACCWTTAPFGLPKLFFPDVTIRHNSTSGPVNHCNVRLAGQEPMSPHLLFRSWWHLSALLTHQGCLTRQPSVPLLAGQHLTKCCISFGDFLWELWGVISEVKFNQDFHALLSWFSCHDWCVCVCVKVATFS